MSSSSPNPHIYVLLLQTSVIPLARYRREGREERIFEFGVKTGFPTRSNSSLDEESRHMCSKEVYIREQGPVFRNQCGGQQASVKTVNLFNIFCNKIFTETQHVTHLTGFLLGFRDIVMKLQIPLKLSTACASMVGH